MPHALFRLGPTHRVRVDGVASPVRRFRLSVGLSLSLSPFSLSFLSLSLTHSHSLLLSLSHAHSLSISLPPVSLPISLSRSLPLVLPPSLVNRAHNGVIFFHECVSFDFIHTYLSGTIHNSKNPLSHAYVHTLARTPPVRKFACV